MLWKEIFQPPNYLKNKKYKDSVFLTYSRNNPLKKFTCHNCYYSVDELNPLISKYGGVYLAGKKGLFYIHASTRHLKSFIKWKWYLKKMKVGIFENSFCANTFIQGDTWWVWYFFGNYFCVQYHKTAAIISNFIDNIHDMLIK